MYACRITTPASGVGGWHTHTLRAYREVGGLKNIFFFLFFFYRGFLSTAKRTTVLLLCIRHLGTRVRRVVRTIHYRYTHASLRLRLDDPLQESITYARIRSFFLLFREYRDPRRRVCSVRHAFCLWSITRLTYLRSTFSYYRNVARTLRLTPRRPLVPYYSGNTLPTSSYM